MNIYEMSDRYFRRLALSKISQGRNLLTKFVQSSAPFLKYTINTASASVKQKNAGVLTDFVKKHPEPSKPPDFKSKILKMRPGPKREQFVFEEVVKRGPIVLGKLVPVTVPGPNGTKVTFFSTSDFIMIDGFRVPMSGKTLQRIANHFKMSIPTSKTTKDIWEAADTKIEAKPLSGTGVTLDGKHYTAKEVVDRLIGDPRAAVAYNDIIEKSLEGKAPKLMAGPGKTIVMTNDPSGLGLSGGRDSKGRIIQKNEHTGHDISNHIEYMTWGRLLDGKAIVELANGEKTTTTIDKILDDSEMYKALSYSKVKKYEV